MLLRQIEHFQAVIEEKSFTEAAEKYLPVCHLAVDKIT